MNNRRKKNMELTRNIDGSFTGVESVQRKIMPSQVAVEIMQVDQQIINLQARKAALEELQAKMVTMVIGAKETINK